MNKPKQTLKQKLAKPMLAASILAGSLGAACEAPVDPEQARIAETQERVRNLTAGQINIAHFQDWEHLTAEQIGELSPEQFAQFTTAQIERLSFNTFTNITVDQLSALSPDQLQAINRWWFKNDMTTYHAQNFPIHQIENLTVDQAIGIQGENWSHIPATHIPHFSVNILARIMYSSRLLATTHNQFAAMTEEQRVGLNPLNGDSTAEDWHNHLDITTLTPNQVQQLDPQLIASLTPVQGRALTAAQIEAFTEEQIKNLQPSIISSFGYIALQGFSADQFNLFSPEQSAAINPRELERAQIEREREREQRRNRELERAQRRRSR